MERMGSPTPGPSGEGVGDELGVRGVWFQSTAEVRRQLGQIMNWEKPAGDTEDGSAIL